MGLQVYRKKRRFHQTPEPSGASTRARRGWRFVLQKHAAGRLHYDFRLELDGVLKSWAVPKGPSCDPRVRSLAVQVEDHPLEYADFEGVIPPGQYGGGTVMLWDRGRWEPESDPQKSLNKGKLRFRLHGEKLSGCWNLIQILGQAGNDGRNWLLIKSDDDSARPTDEFDLLEEMPRSVASNRTMDEIAAAADQVWGSHDTDDPVVDITSLKKRDDGFDLSELAGNRREELPRTFKPQLATPVNHPPRGNEWLHELKFDGYRLLCRIEGGGPHLLTRRGNDWTDRFPTVAEAIADLGWETTIVDGEMVVLAQDGTTDFQALQNLMRRGRDDDVVYYTFDLPFFHGYDLTAVPLVQRKRLLAELLRGAPSAGVVRYSDHIAGDGQNVFNHACRYALEGLVSKRADSRYVQRRSHAWVKSKCLKRQEFVIGGWTEPSGSREALGALLVGYHDEERLVYGGRVGTGFTVQSLHDIKEELDELAVDDPPFDNPPTGRDARGVHWVQPRLIAEIQFANWTDDGLLRQASFQGLREDKPVSEVVREEAIGRPASTRQARGNSSSSRTAPRSHHSRQYGKRVKLDSRGASVASVRLTHPARVLYPRQGITKLHLAEFYEGIANWILPHLVGRPLTLVRCPKGRDGQCFYQRHLTESMPERLRGVEIDEKGERGTYVVVDDLPGLVSLVQMSVLELHPWPAREDRLERPDRLVLDLDPGENVSWQSMIQAAHGVRERLERYGLRSFLRTSGGKGLHVVAPLVRRTPWNGLKLFAKRIADGLTADFPDLFIATTSKARRRGKVFIDYLRNQRGATAIASYSTRAHPGAPIATPIRWDELTTRMKPDRYNVRNLRNRLTSLTADPWDGFFQVKQFIP
jgi:bifunctional non-homologous end joining protein LigD